MSKLHTLLFGVLSLCSVGAAAQSVTVVMKDGTSQRFGADYIKAITFEENSPEGSIDFTKVDVNPYGQTNAALTLSNAAGDVTCVFDMYFPTSAYLAAGEYVIGANDGMYVDNSNINYTYCQLGGAKVNFKSGKVTVSYEQTIYTIVVDAVLDNDVEVKGTYKGEINAFQQYREVEYVAAKYADIELPAGTFLIKMNSKDWNNEASVYFTCKPEDRTLASGGYEYTTEENVQMTFTSKSYFNIPAPTREVKAAAGSRVVISGTGENRMIDLDIVTEDGLIIHGYFRGSLEGSPVIADPGITFDQVDVYPYSASNISLKLKDTEGGSECAFDMYGPDDAKFLQDGVYTIGAASGLYIDADIRYTSYKTPEGTQAFTGGTVTVSHEGETYTIAVDAILADGSSVVGSYKGVLNAFSPYVSAKYDAARYSDIEQAPGTFMLKLNDANWDNEATLYMTANSSATFLPEGTYNFSEEEGSEMSIDNRCYFNIPRPVGEVKAGAGSKVTVTKNGANTKLVMDIITPEGLHFTGTYDGEITGTPVFSGTSAASNGLKKGPVLNSRNK